MLSRTSQETFQTICVRFSLSTNRKVPEADTGQETKRKIPGKHHRITDTTGR